MTPPTSFGMDELSAWTPETVSTRCGVSVRTARRWRQTGRYPPWAALLIRVLLAGDLGAIDRAWCGWTLREGELASYENWSNLTFTPGAVLSIPLMRGQIREAQRRLAYSVQADWVEQRWTDPEECLAGAPQESAA